MALINSDTIKNRNEVFLASSRKLRWRYPNVSENPDETSRQGSR
jgi:hypothetical protein